MQKNTTTSSINKHAQAGLLFVLVLLSRLPFQSHILYHWDSVNFTFGLRDFNVALEQPQSPGYILYVWLAQAVDVFFRDAQTTMVAISMVASALTAVALFYLGSAMFRPRVGLAAALIFAFSPLFWFYSEIALPHTLDTMLVIVGVWWLYEVWQGESRYLYPVIVVLALAGGIRQQTLVFLLPVLLLALSRAGWRRFITAGLLGAAICLLWFIPLITSSGGLSNYFEIVGAYSRRFQISTSIFMGAGLPGIRRNVTKLIIYTLYGWGIAILPVIVYIGVRIRQKALPQAWRKTIFLSFWVAPPIIFYALIHMGQQGLVFIFLPALVLISAICLFRLWPERPSLPTVIVAIILLVQIGMFTLLPEHPLGPNTQRVLTRDTLVNSDQYYEARMQAISENFDPNTTALLAANWHHVEYYLPNYPLLRFRATNTGEVTEHIQRTIGADILTATPAELGLQLTPEGKSIIVLFDSVLAAFNRSPNIVQSLELSNGETLLYLEVGADEVFRLQDGTFGIVGDY